MSSLNLEGIKVHEIHLLNKIEDGKTVEIETKISCEVNTNEIEHKCICKSKVEINSKENESLFRIYVEMDGFFSYQIGTTETQLQADTFSDLFPYIRALITNLTTNAGMPPLIINRIKMNEINTTEGDI